MSQKPNKTYINNSQSQSTTSQHQKIAQQQNVYANQGNASVIGKGNGGFLTSVTNSAHSKSSSQDSQRKQQNNSSHHSNNLSQSSLNLSSQPINNTKDINSINNTNNQKLMSKVMMQQHLKQKPSQIIENNRSQLQQYSQYQHQTSQSYGSINDIQIMKKQQMHQKVISSISSSSVYENVDLMAEPQFDMKSQTNQINSNKDVQNQQQQISQQQYTASTVSNTPLLNKQDGSYQNNLYSDEKQKLQNSQKKSEVTQKHQKAQSRALQKFILEKMINSYDKRALINGFNMFKGNMKQYQSRKRLLGIVINSIFKNKTQEAFSKLQNCKNTQLQSLEAYNEKSIQQDEVAYLF